MASIQETIASAKITEAEKKLALIQSSQPALKAKYNHFLALWKLHIEPVSKEAQRYVDNLNEIRKLEEFIQGQRELGGVSIVKLPPADKSDMGKKKLPLKSKLEPSQAMIEFSKLSKEQQEAVLKRMELK